MQFFDESLLPENQQPLVIQVAPYAPSFFPRDSDDIPLSFADQVQKAVDCWNAGATVLHVHVREPDGNGSKDLDRFNEMLDRLERSMGGLRHAGDAIAHDLRSPLTRLRARLLHATVQRLAERVLALATRIDDDGAAALAWATGAAGEGARWRNTSAREGGRGVWGGPPSMVGTPWIGGPERRGRSRNAPSWPWMAATRWAELMASARVPEENSLNCSLVPRGVLWSCATGGAPSWSWPRANMVGGERTMVRAR